MAIHELPDPFPLHTALMEEEYWQDGHIIERVDELLHDDRATPADAAKKAAETIFKEDGLHVLTGRIEGAGLEVGTPINLNKFAPGTIFFYEREYLLAAADPKHLGRLSPLMKGASIPLAPVQSHLSLGRDPGTGLELKYEHESWLSIVLKTPAGNRSFTVDRIDYGMNHGSREFMPIRFPAHRPAFLGLATEAVTHGDTEFSTTQRVIERITALTVVDSLVPRFEERYRAVGGQDDEPERKVYFTDEPKHS